MCSRSFSRILRRKHEQLAARFRELTDMLADLLEASTVDYITLLGRRSTAPYPSIPFLPYHILPYHILPYHILPHHILPYHILPPDDATTW